MHKAPNLAKGWGTRAATERKIYYALIAIAKQTQPQADGEVCSIEVKQLKHLTGTSALSGEALKEMVTGFVTTRTAWTERHDGGFTRYNATMLDEARIQEGKLYFSFSASVLDRYGKVILLTARPAIEAPGQAAPENAV